jgi:hypothetical protein
MLELVADYARLQFGPASYELTAPDTPAATRFAAVQRFNGAAAGAPAATSASASAERPFLYLITPRSIGLGTRLPGLAAAIILESDYHPRLDIQALHRCVHVCVCACVCVLVTVLNRDAKPALPAAHAHPPTHARAPRCVPALGALAGRAARALAASPCSDWCCATAWRSGCCSSQTGACVRACVRVRVCVRARVSACVCALSMSCAPCMPARSARCCAC